LDCPSPVQVNDFVAAVHRGVFIEEIHGYLGGLRGRARVT
jgi:hypothetical protein